MNIKWISIVALITSGCVYAQTANKVPVFTSTSALADSPISVSGSNIGIGWSSPSAPLQVNGGSAFDTTGGSGTGLLWSMQSGHNGIMPSLRSINQSGYLPGQIESSYLVINGETGGFVGVGTTSPQQQLHVLVPAANSLQWAQVLQNPGEYVASTGAGVGLQFKVSSYAYGNDTENSKWSGVAGVADTGTGYGDYFGLAFYTHNGIAVTPSEVMRIAAAGNVGIGTTSPGAKLEVDGNFKLTSGSGASMTYADGTVQSTAWTGTLTGGDYAESVDVTGDRDEYEPGDVLVIDADHPGHFLKATESYSMAVTGVYSTKPGVVGRRQKIAKALTTSEVPMAMVGIVPTKVTAENGPIKPGDVLVTSSRPGYAMKGTDRSLLVGAVIGKALESLNSDTGLIEALISLQ